jgi:hypothetical protein
MESELTLAPRLASSVLIRYGKAILMIKVANHDKLVAADWVRERRTFEAISEVTTQPTVPQDQVKKALYKHVNATMHFPTDELPALAVPIMAIRNMESVIKVPPMSRIVRRPRNLRAGKEDAMPIKLHICNMTFIKKAF